MRAPPPQVRSLFKAPFKTDKDFGVPKAYFVNDANSRHASSRAGLGKGPCCPRGYGFIQYLPNGETRFSAWCAWLDANIPATATLEEVAVLLTQAWAESKPDLS